MLTTMAKRISTTSRQGSITPRLATLCWSCLVSTLSPCRSRFEAMPSRSGQRLDEMGPLSGCPRRLVLSAPASLSSRTTRQPRQVCLPLSRRQASRLNPWAVISRPSFSIRVFVRGTATTTRSPPSRMGRFTSPSIATTLTALPGTTHLILRLT